MADDKHYVGGDFYRICDRTGFKIRAGRTRKEWNGLIVRDKSWEPRQPQDFVKGVRDYQSAPEPRPRQIDVFVGPLETTIGVAAVAGTDTIQVVSTVRMQNGDVLNIILDNGDVFAATIQNVSSLTTLVLSTKLPYSASVGNVVVDVTAVSQVTPP